MNPWIIIYAAGVIGAVAGAGGAYLVLRLLTILP